MNWACVSKRSELIRTVLLVSFFGFLGFLWFSFVVPPWRGMISGDDSVPYLMTTTPWWRQDFYYWNSSRYGAVYICFWKAIGKYFFGSTPDAFFLGHTVIASAAWGFWLSGLKSKVHWLLFVLILIPATENFTLNLLFPKQLTGILLFLTSVYFWLIDQDFKGKKVGFFLGVLVGLMYWQHVLIGAAFALLSVLVIFWQNRKLSGSFVFGFIPVLVFSEVTRMWSNEGGVDQFYRVGNFYDFRVSLRHFLHHGFSMYLSDAYGLLLLALLIFGLAVVLAAVFRGKMALSEMRSVRATLPALTLFLLMGLVLIICYSSWYKVNRYEDRYFAFVPTVLVYSILKMRESGEFGLRFKKLSLFLCIAISLVANTRSRWGESVFVGSKVWQENASIQMASLNKQEQELLSLGCQGYFSTHWDAYRLAAAGRQTILMSKYGDGANPYLVNSIFEKKRICISDKVADEVAVNGVVKGHPFCRFDDSLWVCDSLSL